MNWVGRQIIGVIILILPPIVLLLFLNVLGRPPPPRERRQRQALVQVFPSYLSKVVPPRGTHPARAVNVQSHVVLVGVVNILHRNRLPAVQHHLDKERSELSGRHCAIRPHHSHCASKSVQKLILKGEQPTRLRRLTKGRVYCALALHILECAQVLIGGGRQV